MSNLQEWVTAQFKAARDAEFSQSDQLSLGELIAKLEATRREDDKDVWFDFENARPTDFDSYRGIYAELAIGFKFEGRMLLSDFIESAKSCVGQTFEGYKGGEYTMSLDTPVWVANYGNSGSTAVVGVFDEGCRTIILTGYRPCWRKMEVTLA